MIVWVASYPRSGNLFTRLLLHHYYGLQNSELYSLAASSDDSLSKKSKLIGYVKFNRSLEALGLDSETYLIKTHELPQDKFPAIYIARDGRDVLISYVWFILERQNLDKSVTFRDILYNLIVSDEYFGGWSRHVLAWLQRPAPTIIIKFEDLLQFPRETIGQAVRDIGLHATEITSLPPPSFKELRQFAIYPSGRRGQPGAWQEEMPPDLEDLFWQRHAAGMTMLGYSRTYNPDEIRVGEGWYPLESWAGETFRWINNDAKLIIQRPTGQHTILRMEVEPGPGLNRQPLQLQFLDEAGQVVAVSQQAIGRQWIEVTLPIVAGEQIVFKLWVNGGGHPTPNDPRILNFRVFQFGWINRDNHDSTHLPG